MDEGRRIRPLTPEREDKFRRVVAKRQFNLTVVLENVHDPHNIGAVIRTCDAVGIREIYVLYTEDQLTEEHLQIGKSAASGAKKWVTVHLYQDVGSCFAAIRAKYDHVFATHLAEDAKSLYELDLTASVALLFGNEKDGISQEALSYADGNFIIPQMGMVQSLNISVACAITLYEALRQRQLAGLYDQDPSQFNPEQALLFDEYYRLHEQKVIDKRNSKKGLQID